MTVTLAGANAHSFKYQKKQLSSSNGRKSGVSGSKEPPLQPKGLATSNSMSNFLLSGVTGKNNSGSQKNLLNNNASIKSKLNSNFHGPSKAIVPSTSRISGLVQQ